MGFNLFSELYNQYKLPCTSVYSKLFKGVKFIPDTLSQNIEDEVITVEAKNFYEDGIGLKIGFQTDKDTLGQIHLHQIYFVYDYNYHIISNIHINEDGVYFDFDSFNVESYKVVSKDRNVFLPTPRDFERLNVNSDYKDYVFIKHKEKANAISIIINKYNEVKKLRDSNPVRTRN